MKHIKKFNELKSNTYLRAARKLDRLGHKNRSKVLKDWSQKVEKDENIEKWKNNIKEFSRFGLFKLNVSNFITILNPDNLDHKELIGDFYFEINFDYDAFKDSLNAFIEDGEGEFLFAIGIIPSTEDLLKEYQNVVPNGDFDNGFYWGMILTIGFTIENGSLKFTNYDLSDYDKSLSGKVSIADRASAGRFKSLLKKLFTDPSLKYPSGYNGSESFFDLIENKVSAESSLSSEYGFNIEKIAEFIDTMSPNQMYKTI